ncbi:hypothetical protein ACH79_19435 [Bradyrhizobium sp. CCBAU 051011]|uniref:hypothetical protein n=1 Tax=Bradyrhizobium sp. CCBAU 051011 TaxID=858422 RepID=UPI001373ECBE|nr:hypothetical protein [Bradyrhizobium sp. CCBAU 051011]QHO74495.1 hypothetical protein ACH79_19435 [Bradyrhizobium sp. CCBAU 051011]
MPNDDTHKPPPEADDIAPKSAPLRWLWTTVKGLSLFTVLSGLFTVLSTLAVGYFQYLNAYQEKVSSQAKEDMTLAAATFTDISHPFSEMQALQQTLYTDFARAVGEKSEASDKTLTTRNARAISERYEKARIELRENIDLLTRKAEIYIDWASDTYRDPAEKRNVDGDPLSRRVLRDYGFDCSDKFNFPAFGNVHAPNGGMQPKEVADDKYCAIAEKRGVDETTKPEDAFIRICAGPNDKAAKRINWYSAKHHVLTMHYCLEAAHNKLAAARQWAAGSDRYAAKESDLQGEKEINAQLDDLAGRLNAFNSLALYQMEQIRVKYRPAGLWCKVPFVWNIASLNCFPIRTASLTR